MQNPDTFPIRHRVPRHRAGIAALLPALAAILLIDSHAAPPDFTKGASIPEGANHDWNLGATGARGWMYSDRLVTTDARQIAVTQVAEGSPAAAVLAKGDVILGVAGRLFFHDPRIEFGRALTVAESEQGGGRLRLTRWRDGVTKEVVIQLPVLGSYSATAPYDCPKSRRILELGCEALAARMAEDAYPRSQNAITRSLNALALLASGERKYLPLVRREARWAAEFSADSFETWWYAYVIMLLSETTIATGDDSVMPGLRRLAIASSEGQSLVGSWGHRFAGPDGRLGGYGMMNAAGVPLTIALSMARRAGIQEPAVDLAIESSARLLRFYIGKGAVPYGDHNPWTETHEDNGKCGMSAVLFNALGETEGAEFFSRMSVASHGPERDTGHTGNFNNILWAMPGVALSGPHAAGAWMREFGAWYFDLARTWDHRFPHQGPPEAQGDSFHGWDATGGCLLAYAMPLRSILLTGRQPTIAPQLDPSGAEALIRDGRGWSNKDRNSAYDQRTTDQLLESLGSWSPTVRERAAMALARRKGDVPVQALMALLDAPALDARYGACEAWIALGPRGAAAVGTLRRTLKAEDLWLRIKASEALAKIGASAMEAVPDMLDMLSCCDREKDPRGMQQRYLSYALFDTRGGMLGRSLDGVDREQLNKAVRAVLTNEDGRARGSFASVYRLLSFEEIKPLLPDILRAVIVPAPSGIMFADVIRVAGLDVLATHRVAEGMHACVEYIRSQNKWASELRTPEVLKILLRYGAHATSVTPSLRGIADDLDRGEEDFPPHLSRQKAASIRDAIRAIEASEEYPELIRLP